MTNIEELQAQRAKLKDQQDCIGGEYHGITEQIRKLDFSISEIEAELEEEAGLSSLTTVAELIEQLQSMPQDLVVQFEHFDEHTPLEIYRVVVKHVPEETLGRWLRQKKTVPPYCCIYQNQKLHELLRNPIVFTTLAPSLTLYQEG